MSRSTRLNNWSCQYSIPSDAFNPEIDPELSWPNDPLLAAISAIPSVNITTALDPRDMELAFLFFASVPRARLLLEFSFCWHNALLMPQDCVQLSSATHLRISSHDNCVFVTPEDGSGYIMQIALTDLPPRGIARWPSIDWVLVPSLPSLANLCIDAALWSRVMHNFPSAPSLADVTLRICHARELDALLGDDSLAHVPLGAALTLTSEAPIAVPAAQLARLAAALGVAQISLAGGVCEVG